MQNINILYIVTNKAQLTTVGRGARAEKAHPSYIMTNDLLQKKVILTKDRPVLSSERAPYKNKTVTVKQ
jgi:hypothetical protein